MKQLFSILLIFAILFSTTGITVASGYCKMQKASAEKKDCCRKKCDKNCCGKQVKVYKLSFDSLPISFAKTLKAFFINIVSPLCNTFFSFNITQAKIDFRIKSPPLIGSAECSFIEVFRI